MTQDVRQWLEEIKRLQQLLVEMQGDRDRALSSAAEWRQLYNIEAQQRRQETALHQESMANLQGKIEELQNYYAGQYNDSQSINLEQELNQENDLSSLKKKLLNMMLELERTRTQVKQLTDSLQQEKDHHAETRYNLTTALADTMDLLKLAQATPYANAEIVPDILTDLNLKSINPKETVGELPLNSQPNLPELPRF